MSVLLYFRPGPSFASRRTGAGASQPAEYITTPEAHGWSGTNTVAQNTAAFNDAVADAETNAGSSSTGRGVVELVQGKTYIVDAANGPSSQPNPAIDLENRSNVEIRTIGKPAKYSGDQAIIMWEDWTGKTNVSWRTIIKYLNSTNCVLGWVTFHGNKNTIDLDTTLDYTSGDGGVYNVTIDSKSDGITVREILSHHAVVDGIVVREKTPADNAPTNILVEDSDFRRNRRQALTVGQCGIDVNGADQVVFRRCKFIETGDFPGDVEGQHPGAGCDIEPFQNHENVFGLTFEDCDFSDNTGATTHHGQPAGTEGRALVVDMKAQLKNFKAIDCRCENNWESVYFIAWTEGTPLDWSDIQIENLVINTTANDGDQLFFGGHGAVTDAATLTNTTIINVDSAVIFFEDDLTATGHDITIWKGDFNPTITTNGRETITINAGFPSTSAPTINGAESAAFFGTQSTTHTYDLSTQSYAAGDYLLLIHGTDAAANVTGVAGATDDTYATILEIHHSLNGSNLSVHEGTVVSGLDASVTVTQDTSRDAAGGLITISGAAGNASQPHVTPSSNEGATISPVASSITTTVDNCLVFAVFHARGGHTPATIAAAVPSGWTHLFAEASGNTEGATSESTVAVAYKVQATAGATGAAEWTSGLDTSQRWTSMQVAIAPA